MTEDLVVRIKFLDLTKALVLRNGRRFTYARSDVLSDPSLSSFRIDLALTASSLDLSCGLDL